MIAEHQWFMFHTKYRSYECCRLCGIVKRKDGKNSPCKGKVGVLPRQSVESNDGR